MTEKLRIQYLYLDLCTCDRCIGTDAVLEKVLEKLKPALETAGYEIDYQKREMSTAQIAKLFGFLSSPTIRVNGRDIFGEIKENDCGCCGEIAGTQVNCRVFEWKGRLYEVPTEEMLANAILKAVFAPEPERETIEYVMPENLRRFYEGKGQKLTSCCCGGKSNCCG